MPLEFERVMVDVKKVRTNAGRAKKKSETKSYAGYIANIGLLSSVAGCVVADRRWTPPVLQL